MLCVFHHLQTCSTTTHICPWQAACWTVQLSHVVVSWKKKAATFKQNAKGNLKRIRLTSGDPKFFIYMQQGNENKEALKETLKNLGAKGNSGWQMCDVKKQGKHWCTLMFSTEKHWGNNKPDIAHHKVPLQMPIMHLSESAKFRLTHTHTRRQN